MKTITNILLIFAMTMLVAWGCSSVDPISPEAVDTGSASFSRFHVVGDNYTAGMQNGGLVEGFQNATWAAIIAQTVQSTHAFPNISENGIPQTMYVSDYSGPTIDVLPKLGQPTNTMYQGVYNNLSIPAATLNQLLVQDASYPQNQNPFFGIVLRAPPLGSAVTQARSGVPTFLAVWAGWTDAFGGASKGTDLALTPAASFEGDYRTMMDLFVPIAGAMVAADLPEFDDVPYFTTIPPVVVDPVTREPILIGGNPVPLLGYNQGTPGPLPLSSLVLLTASPLMQLGWGIPAVIPGGTDIPLPDSVIVDPTERANISGRINQFNAIIDTVCTNRGIPVVDMVALFDRMENIGYVMRGETYTSAYLQNSLFSVDGLHPNSIGNYVIALEFIKVINATFGAAIPQPALPLGPFRDASLGAASPISPAASITPEEWAGLRRILDSGIAHRLRQ